MDMDAVHWKKVQRVVPWLLARRPAARARVHRPEGVDDRHHPGDGVHPLRRVRVGVSLARGRPGVRRPGRAGQGVPLRRRPARRADRAAPEGPRGGPARDVRLHALLPVRRGLPQGRRPDGPDHAPAPPRDRRLRDQGLEQRLRPREGVREHHREVGHAPRGPDAGAVVRRGQHGARPDPSAAPSNSCSTRPARASTRSRRSARGRCSPTPSCRTRRTSAASSRRSNRRTSASSSTSTSSASRQRKKERWLKGVRNREARLLARLRLARVHARSCTARSRRSRRCSTSSSSSSTARTAAARA